MEETDNYSTEYISQGYYRTLVDARMMANQLLTKVEFEKDPGVQSEFKRVLSFLAKEMEPKYMRRDDMDKPEQLEELDNYDLSGVGVDDCRKILESFRELQEVLGITSMARREYELNERGAKSKDE